MSEKWSYGIGKYSFVNGRRIKSYGSSRGGIRL